MKVLLYFDGEKRWLSQALVRYQNINKKLSQSAQCVARNIPVYDGWLTDGLNCDKGRTQFEFASLFEGIIAVELPSTKISGYDVTVKGNRIETEGALVGVYQDVLQSEKNVAPLPVY